jgi:hypothetical protein
MQRDVWINQSEKDEKITLGKMQIKMVAHSLFVRRLAFRETNGDGYCRDRLVSRTIGTCNCTSTGMYV